jgi:hypothetical protein
MKDPVPHTLPFLMGILVEVVARIMEKAVTRKRLLHLYSLCDKVVSSRKRLSENC